MADSMDLFSLSQPHNAEQAMPLAARMRPRVLADFVGQDNVIGPHKFLRNMIEHDKIPSMILFGPPGSGKTTLAEVIAAMTNSEFAKLNAVSAGIGDIRKLVEQAKQSLQYYQKRTIVFIDEIHRFNKGQQDVLLPYVEDGRIILIGATTENPYFEVNAPLLSRVRLVRLNRLQVADIKTLLQRALTDERRGLGQYDICCDDNVLSAIAEVADGDARVALNILEQAASYGETPQTITLELIHDIVGERIQRYDKTGDNHYDVISAFIKSMRGSDPQAAVHYLAKMLVAGENINFIARRIAICAAEDVGNADPQALVVAMAAVQAAQFVGLPEARIPLAQAAIYVASAPKSNAAYLAIDAAMADVKSMDCGSVPSHLRDSHYAGAAKLGHGNDYRYPHNYDGHFVSQQYLPDKLLGRTYYKPSDNGQERNAKERLRNLWGENRSS